MGGLRAEWYRFLGRQRGGEMHILARAFRLIMRPEAEWRSIAVERATPLRLFGYAAVLAAIPAVAGFLGYAVVGVSLGFHAPRLRIPVGLEFERALLGYALWLVGVYVIALIVRWLAPRFEGRADLVTGLKVAVYAPTALWLAGIFLLVPPIGWVSLIGLYSVYTLAIGLPVVTRCPPDESQWYVGAIVLVFIIIAVIVAVAGGAVLPGLIGPAP